MRIDARLTRATCAHPTLSASPLTAPPVCSHMTMTEAHEIHCYDYVNRPYAQVSEALLVDALLRARASGTGAPGTSPPCVPTSRETSSPSKYVWQRRRMDRRVPCQNHPINKLRNCAPPQRRESQQRATEVDCWFALQRAAGRHLGVPRADERPAVRHEPFGVGEVLRVRERRVLAA